MGIHERKKREKQRRREEIIRAAEKVFFTKGFQASTMDEIAEAAELSKGTLYIYFESKEHLHLAVAREAIKLLNRMTTEIKDMKGSVIDRLITLGRAFVDFSSQFPDHMQSILFLEGHDRKREIMSINDLKELVYHDSPVQLVIELVEEGIRSGEIRSDIHAALMANTLWLQMLGLIQLTGMKKDIFEVSELTADALFENHFELIKNGIQP